MTNHSNFKNIYKNLFFVWSSHRYMSKLGVEYHYLSAPVIEQAKCSLKGDSLCSYCSRMKRGIVSRSRLLLS